MKKINILVFSCLLCVHSYAQQEDPPFFQDTGNGERTLKALFKITQKYREIHDGKYFSDQNPLISELAKNHKIYGFNTLKESTRDLINSDNARSENDFIRSNPTKVISFFTKDIRPDGSELNSTLLKGTEDIIAYTDIYAIDNASKDESNITFNSSGYYLTLNSAGQVKRVPYDMVFWLKTERDLSICFWNQAGVPSTALSDEELKVYVYHRPILLGKPYSDRHLVQDNGGPESLIQLSRRINYPNIFGIDREKLWKVFNPNQAEFSLDEIKVGAATLGLTIQVQKLTLAYIEQKGSPALLLLKEDGRIVMLNSLDNNRAVIVDRGITRNVERSVLEKRYSGEALISTNALTQNAGIVADDAVRQIQLKTLEDEVPQSVTLRNTGKVPVTLQLEHPLLGVTESKLSKDTLAPGETATLDLKIKWRSILKAPTQNVLVSLQTSDPIVPRLQLAFLLVPPAAAK